MRRFALLAAIALSFAAPASVAAGGCPTDPGGLVDKETYRVGELIQFFDSYTDFGDPGTTTIHFERQTDGAVLEYTAANIADGTWFVDLRLDSSSFIGRWNVTVTVDQTSGLTTCTDVVTIRGLNAPNTDTDGAIEVAPSDALGLGLFGQWGTMALVAAAGLAIVALYLKRRVHMTPR
jgi:hypothetical protein